MFQTAAAAYAATARRSLSGAELEAEVLLRAARRLELARQAHARRPQDLFDALLNNARLWSVLAANAENDDNPLPGDVRRGIVRLALQVFTRTQDLGESPDPDGAAILIEINRTLAAGLRPAEPKLQVMEGSIPDTSGERKKPSLSMVV